MSDHWHVFAGREAVGQYYFQKNDRMPQYLLEGVLRRKMDTLPLVAPEQVGLSAARLDRVRKWMHGWVDSGKLAGMVTCVMRKGEIAFAEVYGKSDLARNKPFAIRLNYDHEQRHGSGGLNASLNSHTIGAPPIAALGPEWMKRKLLPEILGGEKISALAITEPSGGSDVANLKTTARREGDHYVVNGSKMFITSGMRADYYTVAVRTGGPGAGGVSLLLIERDREGFGRTKLKKMGWWASDTAQLFFDNVRVPDRKSVV